MLVVDGLTIVAYLLLHDVNLSMFPLIAIVDVIPLDGKRNASS